jgi:hypothetical protein
MSSNKSNLKPSSKAAVPAVANTVLQFSAEPPARIRAPISMFAPMFEELKRNRNRWACVYKADKPQTAGVIQYKLAHNGYRSVPSDGFEVTRRGSEVWARYTGK